MLTLSETEVQAILWYMGFAYDQGKFHEEDAALASRIFDIWPSYTAQYLYLLVPQ